MYKRLTDGLNDKGTLIPAEGEVYDYITDTNRDWYLSTFEYNEEQKTLFNISGSVAGITDTITKSLWFDFDSEFEPDCARKDAITTFNRISNKWKVHPSDIAATFSGNKGFGIELNLNETLTPKEVKNLAFELASDLPTFDVKMYNSSRILRVMATKHQKTGLYKIPLSYEQLCNLTTDNIISLAKNPPNMPEGARWAAVTLPKDIQQIKKKEAKELVKILEDKKFNINEIDFTHKVKGWTNCKWALLNGYQVKANDRHEKLLCIISQAKALHNTQEQAYQLAKEADRYGVATYGGERIVKEDLWSKVESVYSDNWKGGTFTCKDSKTTWLSEICNSLGIDKCRHSETESFMDVDKVFNEFAVYAKDIEKNTIKTGIVELDDNLRIVVGQMVGLLGAPSSGKTSIALDVLENTSRADLLSVFYSLDMASSELFQKIAQRVTGFDDIKLFNIFKYDAKQSDEIGIKVAEAYKNVKFCFDTGVSVEKIERDIEEFELTTNKKVKLLLLDYNELLSSPHSDATASSGYNAGAIKKLTNGRGLCTISLLQPPKVIGDASDEITSYRAIKGSSLLEQCFSVIIGLYRPGFSAENNSIDDNYLIMNILKNRLGRLFSIPFYWNGVKGKISPIDDFGRDAIKSLKDKKRSDKSDSGLNF